VVETAASARLQIAASECLTRLYGSDASITVRRENAIAPETSGKFRLARLVGSRQDEPLFDTAQENTP
jgi:hypothetical protein